MRRAAVLPFLLAASLLVLGWPLVPDVEASPALRTQVGPPNSPALPSGCTGTGSFDLRNYTAAYLASWSATRVACTSPGTVSFYGFSCVHSFGTLSTDTVNSLNSAGQLISNPLIQPFTSLFPWLINNGLTTTITVPALHFTSRCLFPDSVTGLSAFSFPEANNAADNYYRILGRSKGSTAANATQSVDCENTGYRVANNWPTQYRTPFWPGKVVSPGTGQRGGFDTDIRFGCTLWSSGANFSTDLQAGFMGQSCGTRFTLGTNTGAFAGYLDNQQSVASCTGASDTSSQPGACCFLPDFPVGGLPDYGNLTGCSSFTVTSQDRTNTSYLENDSVSFTLSARKPTSPPPAQVVKVTIYSGAAAGQNSADVNWPGSPNFTVKIPPKPGVAANVPRTLDYIGFRLQCPDGTSDLIRYDPTGKGGSADSGITQPGFGDRLGDCLGNISTPDNILNVSGFVDSLGQILRCIVEWAIYPAEPLQSWFVRFRGVVQGTGVADVASLVAVPFTALDAASSRMSESNTLQFGDRTVTLPTLPSNVRSVLTSAISLFLVLGVIWRCVVVIASSLGSLSPVARGSVREEGED